MNAEVIKIESRAERDEAVRRATDVLIGGGLVAFPTETVYGVGARADDRAAVARLRALKNRGEDRPFTVHIASGEKAAGFAPELSGLAGRFIRKGWPGPLTLVVSVKDPASTPVMAGLDRSAASSIYYKNTVGLRCPDDAVAEALLRGVDAPVVASSANLVGDPPAYSGTEVAKRIGERIDLVLDAGSTKYARASTIVRIEGSEYKLLREGVYDARIVRQMSLLRFLLVCTGNTCRSPMAAALAAEMLAKRLGCKVRELSARGIEVCSAGTSGGGGVASPQAVSVMARRGLDLSDHLSRGLTAEMVRGSDYIYAMTRAHRDRIVAVVPSAEHRVSLLLDEDDVRDPIGGSEDEYEQCARTVEQGLKARLKEVIL